MITRITNDNTAPYGERFEDVVQPYLIDKTHLHGRFARLTDAVDDVLSAHDYPLPVASLLGELLVLTALLGSTLKHQGIVTVQVSGDGPVSMMVADCNAEGDLRGYAQLNPDMDHSKLHKSRSVKPQAKKYLGKGYIAVTLDHGLNKERYQGIVELKGKTLTNCFLKYFKQSAQLRVYIKTCVERRTSKKGVLVWRAGGMMVQHLPDAPTAQQIILPSQDNESPDDESPAEAWRRTRMYIDTLKPEEMLDVALPPRDVLYRLFHEDGVWVYEAQGVQQQCRCSRERIVNVLSNMSADDVKAMEKDGKITVNCQFCNSEEIFMPGELGA